MEGRVGFRLVVGDEVLRVSFRGVLVYFFVVDVEDVIKFVLEEFFVGLV